MKSYAKMNSLRDGTTQTFKRKVNLRSGVSEMVEEQKKKLLEYKQFLE